MNRVVRLSGGFRFLNGMRTSMSSFLLLALLALLAGCSKAKPPIHEFSGYFEADFVYLSSASQGYLESLDVRRGQQVKKGDPLYQLDATTQRHTVNEISFRMDALQSRIDDAKAGDTPEQIAVIDSRTAESKQILDYAMLEHQRAIQLLDSGAITQAEFDLARTSYERAKANYDSNVNRRILADLGQRKDRILALEHESDALKIQLQQAQWKLDQCTRVSPMDAIIHDILYEPNEWVPVGKPVVVLRPLHQLVAVFYVPNSEQGRVRPGCSVKIVTEGNAAGISGTIRFISTRAEYTPPIIYSRKLSERLVFRVEAVVDTQVEALNPGAPIQVILSDDNEGESL